MEGTNLKCMWKMSIKNLQKYKCDECGKHFILNIGLKGHITAVHEKRFNCYQCGKNLARECNLKVLTQIFHEKDFEFNCDHCGKNYIWKDIFKLWITQNIGLKLQITADHENKKI